MCFHRTEEPALRRRKGRKVKEVLSIVVVYVAEKRDSSREEFTEIFQLFLSVENSVEDEDVARDSCVVLLRETQNRV